MTENSLNFSNNVITTQQIEGLLALFEGAGDTVFEFWLNNVVSTDISDEDKEDLRKNFPRANYLREVILKLAWSIPLPTVCAAHPDGDKATEDPKAAKGAGEASPLDAKLTEMQARRNWEGGKDFQSAVLWWRTFVLVTGDIFVKLPTDEPDETVGTGNKGLVCYPERMPSQRTYIKMSPEVRKVIDGFRFMYFLGSGMFTEQGDMANLVTEIITKDQWVKYEPVKPIKGDTVGSIIQRGEAATAEMKVLKAEVAADSGEEPAVEPPVDMKGILPVAHMAWEEREEGARGIPLALRLADKMLHVLSIEMDRRLGNKMGSVPMYVLENSQGELPPFRPGAAMRIKTEVPFAPAKFSAVATTFSDTSLKSEYTDALRELYHAAFLPFEADSDKAIGDKSGKALQMLSKDQVKYREAFQAAEGSFLQDLFSKACTLEGTPVGPDDIQVKYDDIIAPDDTQRLAEAQFWMTGGFEAKAMQTMGVDEDEAQTMLADKSAADAARLLAAGPTGTLVDENGDPLPAKAAPAKKPFGG